MVALSPLAGAGWQFFSDNGRPLAGGKLYTYAAGTTTPLTVYTSSSGVTPHTNPIILDSAGRVPSEIWLIASDSYKFTLKTSTDVEIWTKDDITGNLSPDDLTAYIVSLRQYEYLATDYGVVANGLLTDNYAALAALNSTVAAAGGGIIKFPEGVIAWSGTITVPSNVAWKGAGSSTQDEAGTTFKAFDSTFQLAFGGRGSANKYNGSQVGFFNVDGNNVAAAPFYIGRALQIDFRDIVIKNGASGGQAWLIEESQNCSYNNCNIEGGAGDGLVLDCGVGGSAFYRCEFNGTVGPGIVIRETTGTGPYPNPTHIKFDHCIIERQTNGSAVRIGQTAVVTSIGTDITFYQCFFAYLSSGTITGNLVDIQRGVRIRFFAPQFSGATLYTTGVYVANGASVLLSGIARGLNMLNFFNLDAGADFDYDQYVVVGGSVTNIFVGTGAQNTYARRKIMAPLQITRPTTSDIYLLNYVSGETQPRSRINGDGSISLSDGTNSPDTNVFRSAARKLGTTGSFAPSVGTIFTVLTAAPAAADLSAGLVVRADGVSWNPLGTAGGVSYFVWYTGTTWRGLQEDANGNNLP